jgi:ABC-2 type transport system permease protein
MMRVALVIEWRRVMTTRLWWILLGGMAVYVGALGAFVAGSFLFAPGANTGRTLDTNDPAVIASLYGLWPTLAYVFPLVLGIMAVTSDEAHRTATSTFLAVPARGTVLGARALAQAGMGALFGVVAALATGAPVVLLLSVKGHALMLGEAHVAGHTVGGVVSFALWAVFGVGIGALVRNQVVALALAIGFSQLVEPIARVGLSLISPLKSVSSYLPGAAGDALGGSSLLAVSGTGDAALLSQWAGGLVLAAYAAVLLAAGTAALARRDIT